MNNLKIYTFKYILFVTFLFLARLIIKGAINMKNIEEIYTEYFDMIYRYLLCLTKDSYLAEELAQETFYKAIVKINTFREDSKISTWLCKIAQNLWYDEIRKHKKNTLNMEEIAFLISDEDIEHKLISNEEKDILISKIDSLDLMTKKVIELRIHGNLKFKDIGAILGKSENWARVTFYRGKIKLKEGDYNEK